MEMTGMDQIGQAIALKYRRNRQITLLFAWFILAPSVLISVLLIITFVPIAIIYSITVIPLILWVMRIRGGREQEIIKGAIQSGYCPKCGADGMVDASLERKRAKCQHCGAQFTADWERV